MSDENEQVRGFGHDNTELNSGGEYQKYRGIYPYSEVQLSN